MNIDSLFTENAPGRSAIRLAEEQSSRPELHSFDEWHDYYTRVLGYPVMVSMQMPKHDNVSYLIEIIDRMRSLTENIFEAFTVRHTDEFGLRHVDERWYICRFVDFNGDQMNYVRFVFWMMMFFHRVNIHNLQEIGRAPFSCFSLMFSAQHCDYTSFARTEYTSPLEKYQYPAVMLGSIIKDIFIDEKFQRLGFDHINVHRLLKWIQRMQRRFGLNGRDIQYVINSARKFGDGFQTVAGGI